tara:strand:+ start:1015 stop:1386 length:372 start_codon:yes stop_codon:yes gene_type:complete
MQKTQLDDYCMVLNDGETFTSVLGCKIVFVPKGTELEQDIDCFIKDNYFAGGEGVTEVEDLLELEQDTDPLSEEDVADWVSSQSGDSESFNATVFGTLADLCNKKVSALQLKSEIRKSLLGDK